MKKIVPLLLCFGMVLPAFAQQSERVKPQLSPLTKLYLQRAATSRTAVQPNYVYKQDNTGRIFLSAIIKVNKSYVEDVSVSLEKIGVHIGTKAGNIWTTQVPQDRVHDFTQVNGIEYIQLDEPAFPTMDEARKATRVDSAHAGINLFCPFTGNGVVVGIIDVGFDYAHPVFFDTTGTNYRVKKVWEQKSTGTPPAGYSYGNEITTAADIWTKGTDLQAASHGSHVAGIAGGSGFGSSTDGRKYRGVAYQSDLVFVGITPAKNQWMNTGLADMLDGMQYIFNYGASVNKPAVANLSWGCTLGPNDGTSLFSQACDNLTGQGKIFVCSGGNNGENNVHLGKSFTATDTIVNTFLNIAQTPIGRNTWVDIWGQAGKSFCAKVKLYHSGQFIDSTEFVCLDNQIHDEYMIGSNMDTCFVDLITSSAEFNGNPRLLMEFRSKVTDSILISVSSHDGNIDMTNGYVHNTTGYYGAFSSNGFSWATGGNNAKTIGNMASTKSAITVGAYASKTSFTNISGSPLSYSGYVSKGDIVPFSSRGPATDGRVKPDITGPGLTLASAVNSFDPGYQNGGGNYSSVVLNYTFPLFSKPFPFAMASGTSMSSPMVAGIVGLMLQADPKLNPQRVKEILFETAIKDNFTGTLPAAGNNTWGHGKINAYRAVKTAWETNSVKDATANQISCQLFPNPGQGEFTITYSAPKAESAVIEVYNVAGKKVHSTDWELNKGSNSKLLNFTKLAKGFYVVQLQTSAGSSATKVIIE